MMIPSRAARFIDKKAIDGQITFGVIPFQAFCLHKPAPGTSEKKQRILGRILRGVPGTVRGVPGTDKVFAVNS